MNDYNKQAIEFLNKTNTTIDIKFSHYGKHFDDDKDQRDVYNVTIKRGNRKFSFKFGNSLANTGKYIGHKHLCLNKMGKYLFSEEDIKQITGLEKQYLEIKKNPNFKAPDEYSILACLQKYDVGSFEDFCSEFGYNEDSITAEKTYKAVVEEYNDICRIFSDEEIEELQEIQ